MDELFNAPSANVLSTLGIDPEKLRRQQQMQGLLGAGLQLLAGSGYSPVRRTTGELLGQAGAAGLQAFQQAGESTIDQALRSMQIQQMAQRQKQQEAGRQAMKSLYERMSGLSPEGALAAEGGQVGPTVARAETIGKQQAIGPQDLIAIATNPDISEETRKNLLSAAQLMSPKEGKETFRVMTPEEKKGLGLPADMAYQVGSSGKILQVGQGPLVKNFVGGEISPFAKKSQELQATEFADIRKSGRSAQITLQDVNKLDNLLEKSGTGLQAAAKQFAGQFGIETKGLNEIQAAQAIINRLVPQQRPPGSGTMSDADLALFKQSLPRIINQPGGNKIIIDTIKDVNNYLVKEGQIAADVLNGKITPDEGYNRMMNLANPLEKFKSGGSSLQDAVQQELQRRRSR